MCQCFRNCKIWTFLMGVVPVSIARIMMLRICVVSDMWKDLGGSWWHRGSRDAFESVGVCDGRVDLMPVAACAPTKRGKKTRSDGSRTRSEWWLRHSKNDVYRDTALRLLVSQVRNCGTRSLSSSCSTPDIGWQLPNPQFVRKKMETDIQKDLWQDLQY